MKRGSCQSVEPSQVAAVARMLAVCCLLGCQLRAAESGGYFGIRVVDEQTGRGVPLVELETVNHLQWVSDSGGWVAIAEPGLMGQTVFFFVPQSRL